jgi:hypothetical protein
MIFINGEGCAFVNDNADASIRICKRMDMGRETRAAI